MNRTLAAAGIVLLAYTMTQAAPKLIVSARRSTATGNGVVVNKDERVSIQVNAEQGSAISIVCVPETTFITPTNQSEITLYANRTVVFVIAASKDGQVSQTKFQVTVGNVPNPPEPEPGPQPGPGPDPKPDPDIPTSKIGKAAYESALKVNSATRSEDAKLIAKTFRATAAKAAGLSSMTYEQILTDAIKGLAQLPDASKQQWGFWALDLSTGTLKDEITGTAAEKRTKAIAALEEIAKAMDAIQLTLSRFKAKATRKQ